VLRDPNADHGARAEALKFVVHFVGDLHQPLHDEDNNDKSGNGRHVIFDGYCDNLHWVWDTGLLRDITGTQRRSRRNSKAGSRRKTRHSGTTGNRSWVLEGHRLAQTVAYGGLEHDDPSRITRAYEQQADAVIELQFEKAGARLAYLLNGALKRRGPRASGSGYQEQLTGHSCCGGAAGKK
jgi:hypothetical protein